jgi:hypothetical protein
MSLAERILYFIRANNLNLSEFDKSIGAANGYIGKQIKKGGSIGSNVLEKIFSVYPQLNVQWLMIGKGEMTNESENEQKTDIDLANTKSNRAVKSQLTIINLQPNALLEIAQTFNLAHNLTQFNDGVFSFDTKKNTLVHSLQEEKFLCVRYNGQEMFPTIRDSTYMVIQNLNRLELNQSKTTGVVIIFTIAAIHIGRLEKNDTIGHIFLTRDNSNKNKYPNIKIDTHEIISLWGVKGYINSELGISDDPKNDPESISSIEKQLTVLENALEKLKIKVGKKKK